MSKLRDPRIFGQFRHLLTAAGTVLAVATTSVDVNDFVNTMVQPENWGALVGTLMAALGFYLSWTAPEKK